jgi:hypothetical protein
MQSVQKYCCDFFLVWPFAPSFFYTVSCLGMFVVHVMHVLKHARGYREVCNIYLSMLCEVRSTKHA